MRNDQDADALQLDLVKFENWGKTWWGLKLNGYENTQFPAHNKYTMV